MIGTGLIAALNMKRNCLAVDKDLVMIQHVRGRFGKACTRTNQENEDGEKL